MSNALAVQDRDIHATEPCAIHAHVCHETAAGIHHGDVIGDLQLDRLALACGNDAPRILQS